MKIGYFPKHLSGKSMAKQFSKNCHTTLEMPPESIDQFHRILIFVFATKRVF